MVRLLTLVYGVACYAIFFGAFLYLVGFLANFGVPKGIDDGTAPGMLAALAVNLALVALFGLQHSIMARPAFKAWWTRMVPKPVERSTYVLATSVILALIYWLWQPIPQTVWQASTTWGQGLLWAAFGGGFLIVLLSTFMTDHFDLFGLRQVYLRFLETPYRNPDFKVIWFYRFVRHPLYTGMFFALWATPHMTLGHLLFAGALTIYVVIAVRFEERDLVAMLGEEYRDYQQRVPMFAPMPGKTSETIRTHDPAPSGMR